MLAQTFLNRQRMLGGGAEKIITKSGEAFIDLIYEASKGLDDVAAGRVQDARSALQAIKSCRSTSD